jgi:hypothetical protein
VARLALVAAVITLAGNFLGLLSGCANRSDGTGPDVVVVVVVSPPPTTNPVRPHLGR